jgi:hypothetical protein
MYFLILHTAPAQISKTGHKDRAQRQGTRLDKTLNNYGRQRRKKERKEEGMLLVQDERSEALDLKDKRSKALVI